MNLYFLHYTIFFFGFSTFHRLRPFIGQKSFLEKSFYAEIQQNLLSELLRFSYLFLFCTKIHLLFLSAFKNTKSTYFLLNSSTFFSIASPTGSSHKVCAASFPAAALGIFETIFQFMMICTAMNLNMFLNSHLFFKIYIKRLCKEFRGCFFTKAN